MPSSARERRAERELAFELLGARQVADARRVAARFAHDAASLPRLSRLVRASLAELHGGRFDIGSSDVERAAARACARQWTTPWSRARSLARLITTTAAAGSLSGARIEAESRPLVESVLREVRSRAAARARRRRGPAKRPVRFGKSPRPRRPKRGRHPGSVRAGSFGGGFGGSHAPTPSRDDTHPVVLRVRDLHMTEEHGHWLRRGPHLVLLEGAPGRTQRRVSVRHVDGAALIGHWLQDGADALVVDP